MKKLFAVFTMVMALFIVNFTTNASAQTNVALGKPATQSSTLASYHVASMCNDGNTAGSGAISVCHTGPDGPASWWQVDLQGEYAITSIVVWNRLDNIDSLCYRLRNYIVEILDATGNVVWGDQSNPDCPRTSIVTPVPYNIRGSKVRITGGPTTDYLNMAEVEVFAQTGIAIKLPSGPCPPNMPPRPDGGPVCGGSYTLADMGYFDTNDVWVWDQFFLDTITIAHLENAPMFGADWLNKITPAKVASPPKISGRLERRHYSVPDQEQMRLVFQATSGGEVIRHAQLLLRECWKKINVIPNQQNVSVPCHSDPNVEWIDVFNVGDGVTAPPGAPLYINIPGTASTLLPIADIESVKWKEKNLVLTPWITEDYSYKNVTYDLTKNFWSVPSNWNSDKAYLHFQLKPTPNLAIGEVANFEIKVRGIDTPITMKSTVRSIHDMPAIPATKQVGSEKKGMKTVNNIAVREIPDPDGIGPALLIQWPEPDSSLFGGLDLPPNTYQVKIFVGAFAPGSLISTPHIYLWYNIPAQLGTCVVDGASYADILAEMLKNGFSKDKLVVGIHYREVYSPAGELQYMNRGFSPQVPINE